MHGSSLEVADIFRAVTPEACFQHDGTVWRAENAPSHRLQANDCRAMGHISLTQLKVMSSIERCRTAALGGHVARCADCAHEHIAYNSCRNHCPAGDCAAICREGGTVPNVRQGRRKHGLSHVRPSCCPCGISIWSSRCPNRLPTSRIRTNARSITC